MLFHSEQPNPQEEAKSWQERKLESAKMAEEPKESIPLEDLDETGEMILETEKDLDNAKLESARMAGEPEKFVEAESTEEAEPEEKPKGFKKAGEDVAELLAEREKKVAASEQETETITDKMDAFMASSEKSDKEKMEHLKAFINKTREKLSDVDAQRFDEIRRNSHALLEKASQYLINTEGKRLAESPEKGLEYVVRKINEAKEMPAEKKARVTDREISHLDYMINEWQNRIEEIEGETKEKQDLQNWLKDAKELRDAQMV